MLKNLTTQTRLKWRTTHSALTACALALTAITACERDFSATPGIGDIEFSADTLRFDTLYAGRVSPTARLSLKNTGDDDVTIGRLYLMGGTASPFGVNINGQPATEATNLRLCHGDSLLIFLNVQEATAAQGMAYGTLTDAIVAEAGGNAWSARIEAVVRNIAEAPRVISTDTQWLCDSIPYLVTDSTVVASGASLVVGPGVEVLMDEGAKLVIEGRMIVAGEADKRARFMPMRTDGFYETIPGQWGGIRLATGGEAEVRYADVACSADGVTCDSASVLYADGLWVRDVSRTGVSTRRAIAVMVNSIISDCGGGAVCAEGGETRLRHVTVADYFTWDYRNVAALRFSLADDAAALLAVDNAIVSGNQSTEVEIDSAAVGRATFRSSLIRISKSTMTSNPDTYLECATATDPGFADRKSFDYHPTRKSPATGLANPDIASDLLIDFEGRIRPAEGAWDAGALQAPAEE